MTDSVEKAVREALRSFFRDDAFLLEANVAERAMAAKLAAHLVPHFPDHQVDVEYNRHGIEPKAVGLPLHLHSGGGGLVFPDVIVHHRGNDRENLLVIQIKKETNRQPRDYDRAVVEAMMREFAYRHGLLLDLPAGDGAGGREPKIEWL
jgi:hypothetical protein